MNTHLLKCEAKFFDALAEGTKTFEIRLNDRDYHVDDELVLTRSRQGVIEIGAKTLHFKVTFVLTGWGLQDGYVALGIKQLRPSREIDNESEEK